MALEATSVIYFENFKITKSFYSLHVHLFLDVIA